MTFGATPSTPGAIFTTIGFSPAPIRSWARSPVLARPRRLGVTASSRMFSPIYREASSWAQRTTTASSPVPNTFEPEIPRQSCNIPSRSNISGSTWEQSAPEPARAERAQETRVTAKTTSPSRPGPIVACDFPHGAIGRRAHCTEKFLAAAGVARRRAVAPHSWYSLRPRAPPKEDA